MTYYHRESEHLSPLGTCGCAVCKTLVFSGGTSSSWKKVWCHSFSISSQSLMIPLSTGQLSFDIPCFCIASFPKKNCGIPSKRAWCLNLRTKVISEFWKYIWIMWVSRIIWHDTFLVLRFSKFKFKGLCSLTCSKCYELAITNTIYDVRAQTQSVLPSNGSRKDCSRRRLGSESRFCEFRAKVNDHAYRFFESRRRHDIPMSYSSYPNGY